MPLTDLFDAASASQLDTALARLADLDVVGVDVERADSDRFFRRAALIQVGGDGRVALVDPLALHDLAPLDAFLGRRQVVLHALENDLVPLEAAGVRPRRMADTAVAATVLGLPTGLEPLLAETLGVQLAGDKEAMQRADWEARPLSDAMCAYAAGDVADLPALWAELERRLHALGRWDWYADELAAQLAQPPLEERREWTRMKGVGRLDPDSRRRARAVWHRREELARATDTAPGRIATDRVLVDLASAPPSSPHELGRRGLRREAVRRFGQDLLSALRRPGQVAVPEASPAPNNRDGRRPTSEERALADRLRAVRSARAESLGLDPGVLCPSRTLVAAVMAGPRSPEELRRCLGIRDWQWQLLAAEFCEALGLPSGDTLDQR